MYIRKLYYGVIIITIPTEKYGEGSTNSSQLRWGADYPSPALKTARRRAYMLHCRRI